MTLPLQLTNHLLINWNVTKMNHISKNLHNYTVFTNSSSITSAEGGSF